ncbi:MAG: YafY family transcriptional regulator [Gammaproteobacteria bacterium]|nr:YafY family transcriptional regulator [Gammaproteobacteria bacterium]
MRRADRLFQIIQLLRNRRITTAKWLAEELEISERTVYRDVQDLMVSGVPIEGEAGIGYVLRRGYDLPPLMFTKEEITALTLGARIVNSWADPQLAKAADQVLNKIKTVLPDTLKNSLSETHLFAPLVQIPVDVASAMAKLRVATEERKKIHFNYTRADGENSTRTVWPLGLFFWGAVWTLGAWCELRHDFRNFRLDRMSNLLTADEYFPIEHGRTLDAFIIAMQQC